MTEKEFVKFIVKIVKWAQTQTEGLPYYDDPVCRDWRRLANFGLFENSVGQIGFALDWESDRRVGDGEIFVVERLAGD